MSTYISHKLYQLRHFSLIVTLVVFLIGQNKIGVADAHASKANNNNHKDTFHYDPLNNNEDNIWFVGKQTMHYIYRKRTQTIPSFLRIRGGNSSIKRDVTIAPSPRSCKQTENKEEQCSVSERKTQMSPPSFYPTSYRGGQSSSLIRMLQKFVSITKSELPQFLSMSTMMFLFIYIFTTVRDTKDTLVVSNCGAESIPFLKFYGVMPSAMIFIVIYSKFSSFMSREGLFLATLIPFFVFYVIFAFVLYPLRERIHFVDFGNGSSDVGQTSMAFMSLIQHWSYSLYYIVSELWASAGVPLLFWQCANDVTTLSQAKRFYPLFAVIGNLAPIVSGKVMSHIVSFQTSSDDVGFGQTLKKLATIKLSICLGIIILYKYVYSITEYSAHEEKMKENSKNTPSKKDNGNKGKASLRDSMNELYKSPSLRAIATMVICYNLCIELTEVLWKGLLRKSYPNKSTYMSFMAGFSQRVGVVAFLLQLMAPTILHKLGWKFTSLIPPLLMLFMAIPFFFALILMQRQTVWGENIVSTTATTGGEILTFTAPLAIGTWQIITSKVTKYALFDPCKEMAYIPLDPDLKVKGKAAVDVMGARLGRSIGSLSQQLLVLVVGGGSMMNCVPFIGVFYVATVGFWLQAISALAKVFDKKEKSRASYKNGK